MKTAATIAAVAVIALIFFVPRFNNPQPTKPAMNPTPTDNPRNKHFVFAKILDMVLPIERGEKYEDPLNAMLHEQHIGEVTGGGTMQRKDKTIEYVGVDIELVNLDSALEATRAKLRGLGAPKGSVLEFKRDGKDTSEPIHDN
jgi:hypothetical protein